MGETFLGIGIKKKGKLNVRKINVLNFIGTHGQSSNLLSLHFIN